MAEKMERVYTIPLAVEFRKVPRWRRSKRAVDAVKKFMKRHMKAETVKIEKELNEEIWKEGSKNPPVRVKVSAKKEDDVVTVQLFGKKFSEKKLDEKEKKKKEKEDKKKAKEEEKEITKKKKTDEEKIKQKQKGMMKNE